MKSVFPNNEENLASSPKKRFSILLLTIALLFTGAVLILFVKDVYHSHYTQPEIDERVLKIAGLRGRLSYLDEALTRSAEMAAVTGDLKWEERYREFEPQLSGAIREAENLSSDFKDSKTLVQADAANLKLVEMENRAFDALREGQAEKAREILSGSEYEKQKNIYADSIRSFDAELKNFHASELNTVRESWLIILIAVALIFSLSAWLATIRNLFKSREHLLRSIVEKEAAEDKRNSEQYQNLFKHANDAILIFEPDGEIVLEVNDKACEMYKLRREEFVGRSLKNMSQNVVRGREELEKLLHDGVYNEFESIHMRGDGTPLHLIINAAVIEYQEKPAILTINRDVTTHKQLAEDLREREQHLLSVTNSAQDAIVSTDTRGNIVFWNEGARKIFGYEENEIIGKSLSILMPEKYREAHARGMRRYAETGERRVIGNVVELEGLKKDGGEFPLELSLGVWEAAKGKYFTGIMRDITERKLAADAIKQGEERFRLMVEGVEDYAILMLDPDGNIVSWNEGAERVKQYKAEEIIGKHFRNFYTPEDQNRKYPEEELRIATAEGHFEDEGWRVRKDGSRFWANVIITAIKDADGRLQGFSKITRDITERKQAEAALRESEYKLRTLLDSMSEGLVQVSNDEVIEFVNDRFCEMTGFCEKDLIGKVTLDILFDEEGKKFVSEANRQRQKGVAGQYELQLKKKSGELLYVIVGGVPIINADGIVTGTMGVFTDITERKRAEDQLLHDAFHDGLTGLANRTLFMEHLRMTIERGKRRQNTLFAALFLDFDRFKVINDSLGHTEGDNFLKLVARRLESVLRPGDLVARLGGDEFTILLSELGSESDAVQIAERIQEDLKNPFELGGREFFISASIGITFSTGGHEKAEDILRDADIAMYRAKSQGRAQHQVFDPSMHAHATMQLQLETEMRRALENDEFRVYYQPIMSLDTNNLVGFEALIRWQHPERGMIPPVEFIPAAEENGLILPLGSWTLYESCRQLREWQNFNPAFSDLTVSVNLSSKQFLQFDLAEQIAETLKQTNLAPRCLKLEITESHVMENSEAAIKMLNNLRELGVELSLDDFGTGYSSLSYLHRLPVDYLKIDRSFVSRMIESKENGEIIQTIIKLAQNLKMKVIAEGIETADQLEYLKNLNCEFGQGYFFSKPVDAETAEEFIYKNSKNSVYLGNQTIINSEINM